jgi:superfamily I DNA and/or RNA helicase
VITFYRAQARLLAAELQKLSFDELRRLRVGTVDEFQGRQFDVVFLSTVRSNEERDDQARRVGFLESPNRLCVALSRAQRLLVIVGDADTVAGLPPASTSVPSLRCFLELCQAEGSYERR